MYLSCRITFNHEQGTICSKLRGNDQAHAWALTAIAQSVTIISDYNVTSHLRTPQLLEWLIGCTLDQNQGQIQRPVMRGAEIWSIFLHKNDQIVHAKKSKTEVKFLKISTKFEIFLKQMHWKLKTTRFVWAKWCSLCKFAPEAQENVAILA